MHGRPTGASFAQQKFLGFIQNHDQVGNRAIGDRLREIVGVDRAKVAAALVLLGPFIPLLFQGEEWAASSPFQYFADYEDAEMARQVSDGRRKEFAAFGWAPESIPDPENPATFQRSKLKWEEVESGEHADMLAWYRALIQLRRSTPDLNNGESGDTQVLCDEAQMGLCMLRGNFAVICNLGVSARRFPLVEGSQVILASRGDVRLEAAELMLPPDAVAVIRGTSRLLPSLRPETVELHLRKTHLPG